MGHLGDVAQQETLNAIKLDFVFLFVHCYLSIRWALLEFLACMFLEMMVAKEDAIVKVWSLALSSSELDKRRNETLIMIRLQNR